MLAVVAAIPLAGNLIWPRSYFGKFWIISIFVFALYIIVRFARLRPRPELQSVFTSVEWVWIIAVVALPLELLMVSLVGGNAGHYFITMIPSIVSGHCLSHLPGGLCFERSKTTDNKFVAEFSLCCFDGFCTDLGSCFLHSGFTLGCVSQ